MPRDSQLNGCDYLMLGFDRELRQRGFSGNACQIVLNLGGRIAPEILTDRVRAQWAQHPLLSFRPGGLVTPRWKRCGAALPPQLRVHRHEPALAQRIFNEPLATRRGELARLDLIEHNTGRMDVIFTWAHALMDGVGGECFLAGLGWSGDGATARTATPRSTCVVPNGAPATLGVSKMFTPR